MSCPSPVPPSPTARSSSSEVAQSRGTDNADENGAWRIDLAGVFEGLHLYGAKATDGANNTSISSTILGVTADMTQGDTEITAGPSGTTSGAAATFRFESGEPGGSFECRIDGGQFEACASPKSYEGLSEGQHTLTVRATDGAGNLTEATRTWTVDSTAPAVVAVTPGRKAKTTSKITVQFNEDTNAASFTATGAFRLKKGKKVVAMKSVTYDPSTRTVTFTPAKLSKGSYTATLAGVKDLAGNSIAANKVWKFRVK